MSVKIILFLWRLFIMKRNSGYFAKGIGTGIAAGLALGVVGSQFVGKNKKGIKKNAGKAMHAVGDLLENVQYMFK